MSDRKQNMQPVAWFWDLYKRKRLDLEPAYQRRSVWNQSFKDYFVDTVLLDYPAPAIFLFEEVSTEGIAKYHVVDGKQRLTTLFEFINNEFAVGDKAERVENRGRYFKDLADPVKKSFWTYQFTVEYLPSDDETIINNIFDRINRNVKRLSPQELRHAQFGGVFITEAEDLTELMAQKLRSYFPNIASGSRKQMKDVELVAHILLMIENGPKGYSTSQLDSEFSTRDEVWPEQNVVSERFRSAVNFAAEMLNGPNGNELERCRLKNQADFYALIGAIDICIQENTAPNPAKSTERLLEFIRKVDDEGARKTDDNALAYYEAARSASNDTGPRRIRVEALKQAISQE